jgi:hypothetical protein
VNQDGSVDSFVAQRQKHRIVIDVNTGNAVTVSQVLGQADYGTVVSDYRIRMQIEGLEGTYRYVCPRDECRDQMILSKVRSRDKDPYRFYFKHRRHENSCAGTAHLSAREICALQFNGAKEGADHLLFKQRIMESIEADPTFGKPDAEKHWVDDTNGKWRQPDVQVMRGDQRIALEVQLSTTFLHVIAERMKFYRDTGGHLIWIFRDLDISNYRQAEDDIFYANNGNAFRVTDQTVARSKAMGRFAIECAWMEPVINAEGIKEEQRTAIVFFDQLHFDVGKNGAPRAYYFDCEAARARAIQVSATLPAIQRFERYWLARSFDATEWSAVREVLLKFGVSVPEYQHSDPFEQLLNVLYSVKYGRMIGYNYIKQPFADLGHHLFDRRKGFLRVFHLAIATFDRIEQVKGDDLNGNLERKARKEETGYFACIKRCDPDYDLPEELRSTVALLFPELPAAKIR